MATVKHLGFFKSDDACDLDLTGIPAALNVSGSQTSNGKYQRIDQRYCGQAMWETVGRSYRRLFYHGPTGNWCICDIRWPAGQSVHDDFTATDGIKSDGKTILHDDGQGLRSPCDFEWSDSDGACVKVTDWNDGYGKRPSFDWEAGYGGDTVPRADSLQRVDTVPRAGNSGLLLANQSPSRKLIGVRTIGKLANARARAQKNRDAARVEPGDQDTPASSRPSQVNPYDGHALCCKPFKLVKGDEVVVDLDFDKVKAACEINVVTWQDEKAAYLGQRGVVIGFDAIGTGKRIRFVDGHWWSFPADVLHVRLDGVPMNRRLGLILDSAPDPVPADAVCDRGCGRSNAEGKTANGRPFTTCCKDCARGSGHSAACDARC